MNEEKLKSEVENVYNQLIQAWNERNATNMANLFSTTGVQIGFDGSKLIGKEEIYTHLNAIFQDHPTPPFIAKIKSVKLLKTDVAMLQAIAGMIPPGKLEIDPNLNAHQTLVVKKDMKWEVELFQNTPAQFHGRPERKEQMTEELRQIIAD